MDEVILVRHGESEASLRGTVSGDPAVAVALTDEGRAQARRLGELLADEPIDLCVVSEFGRVRETADIALAGRDVPRLVLADLNDIRFGEFEGRRFDEYLVWAGSAQPDEAVAGGESRAATARRYVRGFRAILDRPERLVLVVGHGLPIRYVLNAVGEIDPVPILDRVGYAEPHRLAADVLTRAIDRLEAWCGAPSW
jgi:broad specificity phosphatase PhoE